MTGSALAASPTVMFLHIAAVLAASLTTGVIAYSLFATEIEADDSLSAPGRVGARIARIAATVWFVVSAVSTAVVPTDGGLGHRASWIFSTVMVGLVLAFTWPTWNWKNHFAALVFGSLGALAPTTVGTLAHGVAHDVTGVLGMAVGVVLPLWMGATVAHLVRLGRIGRGPGTPGDPAGADAGDAGRIRPGVRRHGILSWILLGVTTASVLGVGLAKLPAADGSGAAWSSGFGRLVLVQVVALAVAVAVTAATWWGIAVPLRRTWTGTGPGHPGVDVDAAVTGAELTSTRRRGILLGLGTIVAVGTIAVTGVLVQYSEAPADHSGLSLEQARIGFEVPGLWSWSALATEWRIDVLYGGAAVALATLYLLGVRRLHGRGDAWPVGRTLSWLAGCVGIVVVTCTGINRYAYGQFEIHMVLHMALNLFVPAAFVLGGPATLVLRAVHPRPRRAGASGMSGPREWVLLIVHSRYTRWLCHPLVAITVYVLTLFGLYFTDLFGWAVRAPWGHEWMNLHFLLTGYLFYWPVIGIDPGTRRLPHVGRLAMLFAIMPFHAFFGVAVMSMKDLLGGGFYETLGILTLTQIEHQQTVGGVIAWISGELPLLGVFLALATQWARADKREARQADRRMDRYGDDEYEAYNRMLAEFEEQRR